MAKDPGRYGPLAGGSGMEALRYALREKEEQIEKLRLELQTCESQLGSVRAQWLEKKQKCGILDEQVTELQAEVGKWKYMAESGARLPSPHHGDLQRRMEVLERENRELRMRVAVPAPQGHDHYNIELTRKIQQLEMDVSALRRKNQALEMELSNLHTDKPQQQRLELDLQYTKAELTEVRRRLLEKNRDVARKDDHIAELERRMSGSSQPGSPGYASQSQVHQLEERLTFLTLENQRLQEHHSQRRYSQPPSSESQKIAQLIQENGMLRAEMITYSEDFRKEREDREREHTRYLEAEERAKKAEQRVMDLETIVAALT